MAGEVKRLNTSFLPSDSFWGIGNTMVTMTWSYLQGTYSLVAEMKKKTVNYNTV